MTNALVPTVELSFSPVLARISSWASSRDAALTAAHKDVVNEIVRRIQRLHTDLNRLLTINAELCGMELSEVQFDPATDTLSIRVDDATNSLRLRRADPAVPIQMKQTVAVRAYHAGTSGPADSARSSELKSELEGLIEQYYYNAHRVLKLVRGLPSCRNFKSKEVTIVRNKLIEHSDHGDIYSFGFGTHGPVVRPIARPGRQWNDVGLVPNTEAFIAALVSQFAT